MPEHRQRRLEPGAVEAVTGAPFPPPELESVLEAIRVDAAAGRFAHRGMSTLVEEHIAVLHVRVSEFSIYLSRAWSVVESVPEARYFGPGRDRWPGPR